MDTLPKRKRNRIEDYDYSTPGAYVITICTTNRETTFWRERRGDRRSSLRYQGQFSNSKDPLQNKLVDLFGKNRFMTMGYAISRTTTKPGNTLKTILRNIYRTIKGLTAMAYSIDEIYDLFMWDNDLSPEEIESRRKQGIEEAMKLKNLYPFLQPIIAPPQNSKLIWEPCAKVLAMRSNEELEPYLFNLLEWIQDMNWPGAGIIYDRLLYIPYSMLEPPYQLCRAKAELTNDSIWLDALDELHDTVVR